MILEWNTSKDDLQLIYQIADRALRELHQYPDNKLVLSMDLEACHNHGCPLDLKGLLEAPKSDFSHDIHGIREHIIRETGKLGDCFLPRYALSNRVSP